MDPGALSSSLVTAFPKIEVPALDRTVDVALLVVLAKSLFKFASPDNNGLAGGVDVASFLA